MRGGGGKEGGGLCQSITICPGPTWSCNQTCPTAHTVKEGCGGGDEVKRSRARGVLFWEGGTREFVPICD